MFRGKKNVMTAQRFAWLKSLPTPSLLCCSHTVALRCRPNIVEQNKTGPNTKFLIIQTTGGDDHVSLMPVL